MCVLAVGGTLVNPDYSMSEYVFRTIGGGGLNIYPIDKASFLQDYKNDTVVWMLFFNNPIIH